MRCKLPHVLPLARATDERLHARSLWHGVFGLNGMPPEYQLIAGLPRLPHYDKASKEEQDKIVPRQPVRMRSCRRTWRNNWRNNWRQHGWWQTEDGTMMRRTIARTLGNMGFVFEFVPHLRTHMV